MKAGTRRTAARRIDVQCAATARNVPTTVVAANLLRSAPDIAEDKRLRALRKDGKVSAVLPT